MKRNALLCPDRLPAIYHPPCRTWGRLRTFANIHPGEHLLTVWSILRIWKYNGILEHPAGSKIWSLMKLPLPGQGYDIQGGFSLSINQSWFGHTCTKNTWLYIKGCKMSEIPDYSLNFNLIQNQISGSSKKSGLKEVSKKNREATPIEFAIWLLDLLDIIEKNEKNMLYNIKSAK